MRYLRFFQAFRVRQFAALVAAGAVVAMLPTCSSGEPGAADRSVAEERSSGASVLLPGHLDAPVLAALRVQAVRSAFPGVIGPSAAERFERSPGGFIRPIFAGLQGAESVAVELPERASAPVRLTDIASGVSVQFHLTGGAAVDAPIALADGIALYAGAGPEGADVFHRAGAAGTEDFIAFEGAPAREEVVYDVDVSGAAGLRLVANTLELLDAAGAPRIRVAPPYIVDASGARRPASIALRGCAADTSPRGPWGRPVTAPGADSCVVAVGWSGADARYPVLVDPQWTATIGSMVTARARHTATPLNYPSPDAGWVLLAGGYDLLGAAIASAEIYEPLSRTFSATGSMASPRGAHSATLLIKNKAAAPTDPVLIAGGSTAAGGGALLGSLELYKPGVGVFEPGPAFAGAFPRFDHTATLFDANEGKVLIAGGTTDKNVPQNTPTSSAEVFTWADSSRVPIFMVKERSSHAAVRLDTGDVLLCGGVGSSNFVIQDAEIFNGGTGAFTVAQMTAPRAYHTATKLAGGSVLVAGGASGSLVNQIQLFTAELYVPGQGFMQVGSMKLGRSRHSATLLPSGDVLIAGGFDGSSALAQVELFAPGSASFAIAMPPLYLGTVEPRHSHTATLVNAGDALGAGKGVLATGGSTSSTPSQSVLPLASAKLLIRPLGDPCTVDAECASGHCSDGEKICCDEECAGECRSCTAVGKGGGAGVDGKCGNAASDTPIAQDCIGSVQFTLKCDGAGGTIPKDVFDCSPSGCDNSTKVCATSCNDQGLACSTKGWCSYDQGDADAGAEDAGGPKTGACKPKGVDGAPCNAAQECISDHCVDGVCCNIPCGGQCQACNIPNSVGVCSKLGTADAPEQPRAPRKPCDGAETECGGACAGESASICSYPNGTACGEPSCSCADGTCKEGPGVAKSSTCDGKAACVQITSLCGGFRCDEGVKCKSACASDDDCVLDFTCEGEGSAKVCKPLKGPKCDGDHIVKLPKSEDTDCSPYKCAGEGCRVECGSVDDCVPPSVCDTKGKCVAPLDSFTLSPLCSYGAGRADGGLGLWVAASAALCAVAARRRGRTRGRMR